jgi:hypothetical protein
MSEQPGIQRTAEHVREQADEVVLLGRSRLAARMRAIRERSHEVVHAVKRDDPESPPRPRVSG